MGHQFCVSCGHRAAEDAKFCEDCGAVFAQTAAPPSTAGHEGLVKKARLVVSSWVIPFNASLSFGTTLVALLDFLSPRVALLPIAATVAVVGLLAALALRKFVAPSLPPGSALRRGLAPERGLHQSPVLIVAGVLSALMVSGAAWSSSASSKGGAMASKFDAVRNAQMQLGVMEGMRREQGVQTKVLEDIREGRTLNPRRELANQGIMWTHEAFRAALRSADAPVVSLFIAGGMKWGALDGVIALDHRETSLASQLVDRPDLLDLSDRDNTRDGCQRFIGYFNRPSAESARLPERDQRAYALTSQDKKWVKLFCDNAAGKELAQSELQRASERHESALASYRKELSQLVSADECRQRELADGARKLFYEGLQWSFPFTRGLSERELMLSVVSNQLANGGGMTLSAQVLAAVKTYCAAVAARKPELAVNDRAIQSMQQIVKALN